MNTETQFTDQQHLNWAKYEKVRQGGRWNMFFPEARRASGLGKEDYSFVLKNYSALKVEREALAKYDL